MKRKRGDAACDHRIIAHIDLDCFYVQVERSINSSLKGKPVGVVQYNPFGDLKSYAPEDNRLMSSGSLIAVSYEARARGVKRSMRGAEAKKVCPEMLLVQVPTSHGKADLTIYREASAKILAVLGSKFPSCIVERASIDEVYLDVTVEATKHLERADPDTFVHDAIETLVPLPSLIAGDDEAEVTMSRRQISKGHSGTDMSLPRSDGQQVHMSAWFARPLEQWSTEDKLLLSGALLVNQLRQAVFNELGFTCSAGIANNKILAKLSSAMHKPNKQTLAPPLVIPRLMRDLPYNRIQGLGGKLGTAIENVYGEKVRTMGQILAVPQAELAQHFGEETAQWLHAVAQGIDHEPVVDRALPISIGCSKSFRSTTRLTPTQLADGTVLRWLTELAGELQERVAADTKTNSRIPKHLHAGASVKVYGLEGEEEQPTGQELEGWAAWAAEEGFSLSKICPMPINASAEAMAKAALQMLTRAIYEHPKFLQAMAAMKAGRNGGSHAAGSGGNGNGSSSGRSSVGSPGGRSAAVSATSSPAAGQRENRSAADKAEQAEGEQQAPAVTWAITGLSMSATNFQTIEVGAGSIRSFFTQRPAEANSGVSATSTTAVMKEGQSSGHTAGDAVLRGQSGAKVEEERSVRSPSPPKKRKITDMFAPARIPLQNKGDGALTKTAATESNGNSNGPKLQRSVLELLRVGAKQGNEEVPAVPHSSTDGGNLSEIVGLDSEDEEAMERIVQNMDAGDLVVVDSDGGGEDGDKADGGAASVTQAPQAVPQLLTSALPRQPPQQQQQRSEEPRSMGDIDYSVFLTLPPDIQREIELTLRLRQQQQTSRSAGVPKTTGLAAFDVGTAGGREKNGSTGSGGTGSVGGSRGGKGKEGKPERRGDEHQVRSMQDIDSAVFLSLPPDIQREVELTMRLRQQQEQRRRDRL